jgi:iron complex transport system substrate-binding protein
VRPPRARQEKPRISAFTTAKIDQIIALKPDLAIGFSDMQADIAQALIRAGVEVWISNHRSVEGILGYVLRLGALVGAHEKAECYVADLEVQIASVRASAARLPHRPRVYFEEWDAPMISAIQWVSELVGIAGGDDIFPARAVAPLGRDRIVADATEVIAAAPDIVIGSWCGKKFRPEKVATRPGWSSIPAVRDGELHEIKSPLILQPGPAALTEGLAELHRIVAQWSTRATETR